MNPELLKRLDFFEMLAKESGDVDRLELITIIRTQAKALKIADKTFKSIEDNADPYANKICLGSLAEEASTEIEKIMGEL